MRFGKSVLLLAFAAALATYAVDCSAMNTPEQAMQCCGSMPCPPHHGNSEDCCKTMPSMHASLEQPAAAPSVSTAHVVLGILPTQYSITNTGFSANHVTANSHAPPAASLPPTLPLRI
jgi:hypothetical protein